MMIAINSADIAGMQSSNAITPHDKKALGYLLAAKMLGYPLHNRETLLKECEQCHGFSDYLSEMVLHNNESPLQSRNSKWSQFLASVKQKITLLDQERIEALSQSNPITNQNEQTKIEQAKKSIIVLSKLPSLARLSLRVLSGSSDKDDIACLYNIVLQSRFRTYAAEPNGQNFSASSSDDAQFIASLERIRKLPKEQELLAKNPPISRL